jgi:predicted TIM-barrel fold metal-dependent hydrolase
VAHTHDRATFIAGLGALAALAVLPRTAESASPRRIDVHRHVSPPFYADTIKGAYPKPFPPPLRPWTPERCLADMDAAGVETGILSMPARPGMYFGDADAARKLCRASNEYMAELVRTYPGRFGFFAALPLPDVPGALAEVGYAFDVLKANGAGVWSSYGTTYLGDAPLQPLWAELDRRNGIVLSHPTDAACCANPVSQMSETVVEFAADTTRTIGSLIFSGTTEKYPNVRFIFTHGGGLAPFVVDRFLNQAQDPKTAGLLPHGVRYELARLYYDTAFASSPEAIAALLKLVPPSHVFFGTDYPYNAAKATADELATCGLAPNVAAAIDRQGAAALFRFS